jgi:MFS family permease
MTPQPTFAQASTGGHLHDPRAARRLRRAAYVGMVAGAGGGLAIFPLFPALQADLGIGTAALGPIAAAGFLGALVAELALAPQADRGRARAMAVTGLTIVVLSLVGSALAAEAWQLVAARALGGIGAGLFLPAASALLIRLDPDRAGESLGRLSTAELGGIAVGPLASSILVAWWSPQTVLLVIAGVVAVAIVPVALHLVERPHAPDHAGVDSGTVAPPPALAFDLLRHRRVWGAGLLTVAVMIPVGAYDALWPRFMADLGAGELLIGASFVVFAIPFMVVAAPAGRLSDRIGGERAFARGLGVLIAMILLYAIVTDPYVVTGIGMIESSGQALAFVGAATAMAQAVTTDRAGAAQGLSRAMGLIAATLASAIAGWVYVLGGAALLFGGAAVVTLLVALLALRLLAVDRRRRSAVAAHAAAEDAAAEAS